MWSFRDTVLKRNLSLTVKFAYIVTTGIRSGLEITNILIRHPFLFFPVKKKSKMLTIIIAQITGRGALTNI